MRPLRGGQGTFDRILNNIRQVAGTCRISIGGNFDESSVDSYPALLDFLREQEFADKLAADVRKHFRVTTDEAGSIGKRYRRQDEIGTPFGVTVDFDTIEKGAGVTLRHRDSMEQTRIPAEKLVDVIRDQIENWGK